MESSLTLATLPGIWRVSPAAAQSGTGLPPLSQPAEPTKAAFLARARALRDAKKPTASGCCGPSACPTIRQRKSTVMSNDNDEFSSLIHNVQQARQNKEKQSDLLEEQAKQVFQPIKEYLMRMNQAVHTVGATVEIDPRWEPLGDQKLRRTARVASTKLSRPLPLDFTIQGALILLGDKTYEYPHQIDALKHEIRRQVEQFLMPG
jgi:hypothetical protein